MKKYHKLVDSANTLPENVAQSLTLLLQNPTIHAARMLAVTLAEALLQAEADAICGPRYKNDPDRQFYRWGSQPGYVCVAAVKTPITRPRVRTKDGKEVQLETYKMLQNEDTLCEETLNLVLVGVSCRNHAQAVEAVCGRSVSASSVSRRIKRAAAEKLKELMERDLSELDIVAVVIDGKVLGKGHMVIVALGVDAEGRKWVLGVWPGATENAEVAKALLADLLRRGLKAEEGLLFVVDGSRALRKAIKEVFGDKAVVQRCVRHKMENVLSHLPDRWKVEAERRLKAAWGMEGYDEAKEAMDGVLRWLRRLNEGAARSLKEGLEETLTLHRLGVRGELRRSLRTTNLIESCLSLGQRICGRVSRWRDVRQVMRWCGLWLVEAEKRMRRVRGWRGLLELKQRLREEVASPSIFNYT